MQKRILITLKDITEAGGGERVGVNLANAFAQDLGQRVQIVSFFRSQEKPCYALDSTLTCTYLCNAKAKSKNPLTTLLNKTLFRLIFSYRVHKLAQKSDIILANDGWFVPLFKDKTRFFKNSQNPHKPLYIRLWHLNAPKKMRKKLALFDTLVIPSSKELSLWQRYHNFVRVIPNFLPQIPSLSTTYSQKVVLSVGRLSKEKGFFRLLDIWKLVQESIKNPPYSVILSETKCSEVSIQKTENRLLNIECQNENCVDFSPTAQNDKIKVSQNDKSLDLRNDDNLTQWQLIIVGDGVLKKELESKIKALNLQESVILKPFTKQIEKEYLSASIYAMTSHFEGFGMVLAEASSYGLPCVAFDIKAGPSDIIADEKSGFLVADNDLQGYADKLMLLMRDENLRQNFGTKAKQVVSEKFSKEVVMKEWQGLFDEQNIEIKDKYGY